MWELSSNLALLYLICSASRQTGKMHYVWQIQSISLVSPLCNWLPQEPGAFTPGAFNFNVFFEFSEKSMRIPGNNLFLWAFGYRFPKSITLGAGMCNWSLCCLQQMNRRGSQCTKKQKKFIPCTWRQFWTSLQPFERHHSFVQEALLLEVFSKKCWRLLVQLNALKCLLSS